MLRQPTNACSEPSPLRFGSDKNFKRGAPYRIRFSEIVNRPMVNQQKKKKKSQPWKNGTSITTESSMSETGIM